jgi:ribosomal protein S12 methylthiotransferase accessory factor
MSTVALLRSVQSPHPSQPGLETTLVAPPDPGRTVSLTRIHDLDHGVFSGMTESAALELDGRLGGLISPVGGVISHLERLGSALTRSMDTVTFARLGEVGVLREPPSPRCFGTELDGIGCHADPEVSARIAVMEALERYAAAAVDERRWLTGSAVDVGPDALDLTDAARCAISETAAPGFPLAAWDPTQPLRWVRGWSLLDGRDVWVPAVMAHLGVTPAHPTERFWLQTSSGCAASRTQEEALLAACLELIERDAVAISWLQRLALRRVDLTDLAWRSRERGRGVDTDEVWGDVISTLLSDEDRDRIALFDATSDLGVPTVLSVLTPPAGSGLPPAVGAACSDSRSHAVLKALRELTVVRACVWRDPVPGDPAYPQIPDEAFAHLFGSEAAGNPTHRTAAVAHGPRPTGVDGDFIGTTAQRLARIVTILARQSSDVVAVELTPVDFGGSGVRVVRVIAPSLVPFLAYPSVRYLGSRRVYEAPGRMGFRVLPEKDLNPWPSPLW